MLDSHSCQRYYYYMALANGGTVIQVFIESLTCIGACFRTLVLGDGVVQYILHLSIAVQHTS